MSKRVKSGKVRSYRQGDVLLVAVEELPSLARAERVKVPGRPLVLARGEASGHAHVVANSEEVEAYRLADGTLLVVSERGLRIEHEEHEALELPGGAYRVVRQREYWPDRVREVRD